VAIQELWRKNGAGKSTLLKILSRVTAPTTGSIKFGGRVASLLEVEQALMVK
jgi:lipopolysaccharide transport system ATP-binding protein